MKKWIAFILCIGLLTGLCACGSQESEEESTSFALRDDSAYQLRPDDDADEETAPIAAGGVIALAVDGSGVETGVNAALWRGVQAFCQNFGATAQLFAAEGDGAEANEEALRRAAESGAELVVCGGAEMELPLFALQNNYPSVSYLMVDGEPHSEDHANYQMANNVHCVLFNEEQAGYLAGYAAVSDGYASLGFLGADQLPGIVRYGTGFLQGAQAAAEQNGMEISLKIWYCGQYEASEEITARMSGWYAEGTELIFAAGGTLAQSCVDAAAETGGLVLAADWDQDSLGSAVIGSAVKRYSTAVQNLLYAFYADGPGWNADQAGQTERRGVSTGDIGLSTTAWGFLNFSLEEYERVYDRLWDGTLKVERYSDPDPDNLPQMPNVLCDYQN